MQFHTTPNQIGPVGCPQWNTKTWMWRLDMDTSGNSGQTNNTDLI